MSNFDENSNVIHPVRVSMSEGECSTSSPRFYTVLQPHNVQTEANGSQQLDAPNNLSGQREAASSREQIVRVDPGHAAFPTSATGDALESGLGTSSGRQLVNSMTEGGTSGDQSATLDASRPLRRGSSCHSASTIINEVVGETLPNAGDFSIFENLMFDNTINWEGLSAEVLGAAMQKMSRDNHFSLNDIPRKCRELCESTQYWATGPDGRGGISEAFAKRLFEFMEYDEGKLFIFSSHVAVFLWRGYVLSWSLKWRIVQ